MEKESRIHLYGRSIWRRHLLNYRDPMPMKKTKIHIPPVHFTKNGARACQWNDMFTVLSMHKVHKLNGKTYLSAHKGRGYEGKQLWSNWDAIPICALMDWGKSQKNLPWHLVSQLRGAKVFWKSRSHLNSVGTRRLTGSKIHSQDQQILLTIIQNRFTWCSNARDLGNPVLVDKMTPPALGQMCYCYTNIACYCLVWIATARVNLSQQK